MVRSTVLIAESAAQEDRELMARAGIERASTASLFAVTLAALGASHLSYDSRTTASVFLPAAVFLALWLVRREHPGAELCRRAYGWAATIFAVLSVAAIPALIILGPVGMVSAMTTVIAAWMRSMSLVVLSLVCAAVSFVGLGGALAYAAEAPAVNVPLCVGLLAGLGLAYVAYAHQAGSADRIGPTGRTTHPEDGLV